jgi:transcriptional regulator PpsR
MEARASSSLSGDRTFIRGILGGLDAPVAQSVAAAGGDVTMVIDREGVIRDMALGTDQMARDGADSWLDRPWSETVTKDSRRKVEELLRDAVSQGRTRWREVNQITASQDSLLLRFVAVDTGREGRVIAIGRDERSVADMQQRLMAAQQAMERDYSRLRDAEFRYRLLFHTASEAVIIVDPMTRRIIEANPAAHAITGADKTPLQGEPFIRMFEPDSQEGAASLLTLAQSTAQADRVQMRLHSHQREFVVSASLFRQDRGSQCLVRLSPAGQPETADADAAARLSNVIERIPDAFVVTDDAMRILIVNTAFLQLVRLGAEAQARGQLLTRFLGREGLERNLLLESLRDHGSVRNFATVMRGQYDEQEDVEVSGVAAPDGEGVCFGFTIRRQGRRLADRSQGAPQLQRSVEQLTELVGRVKLKELVRETTDLVERLCIEAALELTKDNRASAADVLGLSRQSLYSKLHRFGLVNSISTDN